jgi:hypothetical protein
LTIAKTPNVTGTASITVTAIANEAYAQPATAKTTFHFAVFSNNAPTVLKALEDVNGAETFSLNDYFKDDRGQLTYSLTVEDPNVVNATLVGSTLYVQNGLFRDGRSLVTITASDGLANVSSALNATYSFAGITFQFQTDYVYVINASRYDAQPIASITFDSGSWADASYHFRHDVAQGSSDEIVYALYKGDGTLIGNTIKYNSKTWT